MRTPFQQMLYDEGYTQALADVHKELDDAIVVVLGTESPDAGKYAQSLHHLRAMVKALKTKFEIKKRDRLEKLKQQLDKQRKGH